MIHVIAVITTQPGKRAAVLKEFRANVPAVHEERGCIEYTPVTDAEGGPASQARFGEDTFVVVEKWESMEALAAHAASPHMKAYGERVAGMIAKRVVHVLSPE